MQLLSSFSPIGESKEENSMLQNRTFLGMGGMLELKLPNYLFLEFHFLIIE
jgi:hypothetical protein